MSMLLWKSAKLTPLLTSWRIDLGEPVLLHRDAQEDPAPRVNELVSSDLARRGDLGRCCCAACAVGLSSPLLRFGDAESLRSASGSASGMRSRSSWLPWTGAMSAVGRAPAL